MARVGAKPDKNLVSLIHFFGPDGSGKSLQTNILVDFLGKRGYKVRKCWLRAHHTLAFVLWKLLVAIGFYRIVKDPSGEMLRIPAVNEDVFFPHFWSIVEFVGVLPKILQTNLSILRGYHLVADRYILDTVTSVAYVLGDIDFLDSGVSKFLFRLIPKDTFFIFLDSDYEAIRGRRTSQSSGQNISDQDSDANFHQTHMEPRNFIEFQRVAYSILARSFDALVIDTSETSISETSKLVLQGLGLA